ncbi:uncharacterized protein LOC100372381 [Saccoglossus kowalevskii]|uniref:Extradiol dioxygenase-like protein 557 n=1 Tax=Saccoglossus kowalevskii TaxID=10224 RepID=A0A1L7H7F4_SACKO|nr:PREDICTED: uncharacterized protein LOC100372381 [Saccoglossus kowalevskii]APU50767.1 extradiol dioxygenase-like protein 557 [Saccoglossus kowalevskii]
MMLKSVVVIVLSIALYVVTRPRPPLSYENKEGNAPQLSMPIYYSHVGLAVVPETAEQHFDMLRRVFLMNLNEEGKINLPPPPKVTQYIPPVFQPVIMPVFHAVKRFLPTVLLSFLSRDPRDHHQIAVIHARPEKVEYNELHYYAFRVDSLETLQRMMIMLKEESTVTNVRAVNECDQLVLYVNDVNGDLIKVYMETGYHVTDFVQVAVDLNSKNVEQHVNQLCSKLSGFQTKRAWLQSLKKQHPQLESLDKPSKFWAANHTNDPWQRNISFSHISVKVHNLDGMVNFYSRVLGLIPVKYGYYGTQRFVHMISSEYRPFEFIEDRPMSLLDLDFPVCNQFSFRIKSLKDLREFQQHLSQEPVHSVTPISHGSCWAVYFCDPENNRIEIFADGENYVNQPVIEDFDLSKSDEELHDIDVVTWQHHPSFQPNEEYHMKMAKKLHLTEKT